MGHHVRAAGCAWVGHWSAECSTIWPNAASTWFNFICRGNPRMVGGAEGQIWGNTAASPAIIADATVAAGATAALNFLAANVRVDCLLGADLFAPDCPSLPCPPRPPGAGWTPPLAPKTTRWWCPPSLGSALWVWQTLMTTRWWVPPAVQGGGGAVRELGWRQCLNAMFVLDMLGSCLMLAEVALLLLLPWPIRSLPKQAGIARPAAPVWVLTPSHARPLPVPLPAGVVGCD
jgi:hypothetical protein